MLLLSAVYRSLPEVYVYTPEQADDRPGTRLASLVLFKGAFYRNRRPLMLSNCFRVSIAYIAATVQGFVLYGLGFI